eukprot:CAMPEP_0118927004 /NCGR_PEP_ID=MMETSP1169-20130426/4584_1 /TAXON_ID=36882 /ORGANISM="Pyramimonas obovata, Strain CCMP722" /LENGTH=118 /DNA_ID=CAMNT_0006868679 /DNA_START=179 /DNA_END=533 /DNA_ORIENTATION=+
MCWTCPPSIYQRARQACVSLRCACTTSPRAARDAPARRSARPPASARQRPTTATAAATKTAPLYTPRDRAKNMPASLGTGAPHPQNCAAAAAAAATAAVRLTSIAPRGPLHADHSTRT